MSQVKKLKTDEALINRVVPLACWFPILRFAIRNAKDIAKFAGVCKKWKKLLYRFLAWLPNPVNVTALRRLHHFKGIQNLEIVSVLSGFQNWEHLFPSPRYFHTSLTSLVLTCDLPSYKCLHSLLYNFNSLKALDFSPPNPVKIAFETCSVLRLSFLTSVTTSTSDISLYPNHLQDLQLTGCPPPATQIKRFTSLTKLCIGIKSEDLSFLDPLTKLRSLTLSASFTNPIFSFSSLKNQRFLKSLTLLNFFSFDLNCPTLALLHLSELTLDASIWQPQHYEKLQNLKTQILNLKSLTILNPQHLSLITMTNLQMTRLRIHYTASNKMHSLKKEKEFPSRMEFSVEPDVVIQDMPIPFQKKKLITFNSLLPEPFVETSNHSDELSDEEEGDEEQDMEEGDEELMENEDSKTFGNASNESSEQEETDEEGGRDSDGDMIKEGRYTDYSPQRPQRTWSDFESNSNNYSGYFYWSRSRDD
jgi:hypothetical protein